MYYTSLFEKINFLKTFCMRLKTLEFTSVNTPRLNAVTGVALLLSVLACQPVHRQARTDIVARTGIELPENPDNALDFATVLPQSLFEAINQLNGLRIDGPEISEDPAAPIFLILKDIHGSPEHEKAKLEALLQLGINTVMVEGWAGNEADQDRGYRLLNGEKGLITELLNDSRFRVFPLENAELQEEALMTVWAKLYVNGFYLNEWLKAYDAGEPGAVNERLYDIRKLSYQYVTPLVESYKSKFNLKDEAGHRGFREKALSYARTSQAELKRRHGESWRDYEKRINPIKAEINKQGVSSSDIVLLDRNRAAVKLLYEHIEEEKIRVAVVIFGAGHFSMGTQDDRDLIFLMRNEGDCTVAFVEREVDLRGVDDASITSDNADHAP